jgi:hypothetical protein
MNSQMIILIIMMIKNNRVKLIALTTNKKRSSDVHGAVGESKSNKGEGDSSSEYDRSEDDVS